MFTIESSKTHTENGKAMRGEKTERGNKVQNNKQTNKQTNLAVIFLLTSRNVQKSAKQTFQAEGVETKDDYKFKH